MVPQLRIDDILGGTFCSYGRLRDPHSVMMGFMLNARARGVRLWLDTEVTGIEVEDAAGNKLNRLDRALVPRRRHLHWIANTGTTEVSPAGGGTSALSKRAGDRETIQ